jgi:CRISPR/Cas system-associated exonuclease Cas4 (RecB family)
MTPEDLKNAILRGADVIDARKTFSVDRSKYLNASEALSCIRKQWFSKHEPSDAPQDWGFARRGTHGEKYVVEMLRASGIELMLAGDDQESVADDELRISATPDGVLFNASGAHVALEIKTIDPRTNRANLPRREHLAQIQIAMELLIKVAKLDISHGLIVYMDASNYNQLDVYAIGRNPGLMDDMALRANQVLKTRNVERLDREGRATGDCKKCPYAERCGVDLSETKAFTRSNRGSQLDTIVQRYVEIKEAQDALSGEKDALAEEIKEELRTRNTSSTIVGDIEVELSSVAGRSSLDQKAMEKAGLDLTPFKKIGLPSERLTVKPLAS